MIKVSIADECDMTRLGMIQVISGESDLRVVHEAKNSEGLITAVAEKNSDVLILSRSLPHSNIFEIISAVRARSKCKTLLLLSDPFEFYETTGAMADGYNLRTTSAYIVPAAIRSIMEYGAWIGPALASTILTAPSSPGVGSQQKGRSKIESLTPKETDVLTLLSEGFDIAQIAQKLSNSPETVRVHIKRINKKLDVHDRGQAIAAFLSARISNQPRIR